jgi:Cu(I)/Ag(I) efflux system periplasmic protein CusF
MKKFINLVLLLSAAAAAPTIALAQAAVQPPAMTEKAEMKDAAQAEVRKIDKDAKKVTLKHGPIKNLDMPSMTMVFQVKDAALLEKIAVGDKIMFTAEQQQGAYVMTGAEKEIAK